MVIKPKLSIEIEPKVSDVCAVISAVVAYYPGQEVDVLTAIKNATEKRITELKKLKESEQNGKRS